MHGQTRHPAPGAGWQSGLPDGGAVGQQDSGTGLSSRAHRPAHVTNIVTNIPELVSQPFSRDEQLGTVCRPQDPMEPMNPSFRLFAIALAAIWVSACAYNQSPPVVAPASNVPRADMPESVQQELSDDLAGLQESISVPVVSGPLSGPLSRYREFASATRGGAVMSSPSDRAQVVTTVYPGTVMGLSGKKTGDFVEVGYEHLGGSLTGWVDPNLVGLVAGRNPAVLTTEEKKELYKRILERVNDLVAKWKDNPYVSIGGFSINVDQAPSVNVDIRYK